MSVSLWAHPSTTLCGPHPYAGQHWKFLPCSLSCSHLTGEKKGGGGSLSRGCSEPNPCPSWAPAVPTPCCLPQDTGTSSLSSVGGLLPTPQPPTLVELSWVSHSVSGIPTQTSAYSLNLWPVHNASPPRIPPAPPCTQFPLSPHQIRCVSFSKCTGEQQPLRTVCWPYHMG